MFTGRESLPGRALDHGMNDGEGSFRTFLLKVQMIQVPSKLAVAILSPAGDQAMALIVRVWPSSTSVWITDV